MEVLDSDRSRRSALDDGNDPAARAPFSGASRILDRHTEHRLDGFLPVEGMWRRQGCRDVGTWALSRVEGTNG
jgi:hypothetical protein